MNAYLPFNATELWHVAGWTMIHFLWLGTLVATVALIGRMLLRRADPNVRYATALCSLVVLATMPLAIAAWLVQISLPASGPIRGAFATSAEQIAITDPAAPPIIELSETALSKQAVSAVDEITVASPRIHEPSLSGPGNVIAALELYVPYLPWLWMVGTPITFALLVLGIVGTRRLQRASAPIENGPIADLLAQLTGSLRIARRVGLAVCDRIAAPVLVGVVRPVILLPPAALTGWSPDEIEMVLLHELAHVRRWDNLVNLLQRFTESLLFFHPAVWLVSNWVRREREACCDAAVVAHTHHPHAYAELLLALAAQMPRSVLFHPAASSAMAAGPLRRRIRRILQLEDDPMLISGKSFTLMLATLLTAATLAMLYLPTIGQAEESSTVVVESAETATSAGESARPSETDPEPDSQDPGSRHRDSEIDLLLREIAALTNRKIELATRLYQLQTEFAMLQAKLVEPAVQEALERDVKITSLSHELARRQIQLVQKADSTRRNDSGRAAKLKRQMGEIENQIAQYREQIQQQLLRDLRSKPDVEFKQLTKEFQTRFEAMQKQLAAVELTLNEKMEALKNGVADTVGPVEEATLEATENAERSNSSTPESTNHNQTEPSDKARTAGLERALQKKITLVVVMFNDAGKYRPQLRPIYEKLSREGKTIWLYGVDIDPATNEAKRFGVGPGPTLIIFRKGKETARLENIENAEQLNEFVAAKLGVADKPKGKFPSLEDQKLADLAFRRTGWELEPIGDDELARVKALGYTGGVAIAYAPQNAGFTNISYGTIETGDILVGLHVWPTRDLKDVAAVLGREDLAELNPIKFYVARRSKILSSMEEPNHSDVVVTGRVFVNLRDTTPPTSPHLQQAQLMQQMAQLPRRGDAVSQKRYESSIVDNGPSKAVAKSERPAPGEFPYAVQFEQSASRFLDGDNITIREVRGTAQTFEPGNKYWIKGTYTLGSRDRATLSAFTTAADAADATSNVLSIQTTDVERGEGDFTLILPMSVRGWPHVSFYPAGGGDGFGGTYFGTGDSVLKKWWGTNEEAAKSDSSARGSGPVATPQTASPLASNKSNLRYDGKTFDWWRSAWRTELSTEKRLEAVKALAAFGANGYGREAAEAILDVVKQYDWRHLDGSPVGKLKDEAIIAYAGTDTGAPHIPTDDWLPVLIGAIKSDDKKAIEFAERVVGRFGRDEANLVSRLIELSGDEDLKNIRPAILARLEAIDRTNPDPRITDRMVEALRQGPEAAQIALRTLYFQRQLGPEMMARGGFAGPSVAGFSPQEPTEQQTDYRPELLELLSSEDRYLRRQAIRVLARLEARAQPALPGLYPLLLERDPEIAGRARLAIRAITGSDDAAIDFLEKLSADEQSSDAERAQAALKSIKKAIELEHEQEKERQSGLNPSPIK